MYTKFKQKKNSLCRVLKKINDNAYKVNLPPDVKTSNVFNAEDLTLYKGEEPLVDVLDNEEDLNSRATIALWFVVLEVLLHSRSSLVPVITVGREFQPPAGVAFTAGPEFQLLVVAKQSVSVLCLHHIYTYLVHFIST
ncbi:hypothetical protein AAC387_Pa04g1667 [Persea americana]